MENFGIFTFDFGLRWGSVVFVALRSDTEIIKILGADTGVIILCDAKL